MDKMQENIETSIKKKENFAWKHFWNLLSKPLKILLSLFGFVTGTGLIGLWTSLTGVMTTLGESNQSYEVWVKFLVIFVMIVLVGLFLLTMILAIGFMRIKFLDNDILKVLNDNILKFDTAINGNVQKFNDSIHKLNVSITQFTLSEYILDKQKISELEGNVGKNKKIIVMSSKFGLDCGELQNVILDNLRKGIQYIYLIPEEDSKELEMTFFREMVENWWNMMSHSFQKDKPKAFMCDEYKGILKTAVEKSKEEALLELKAYFCRHISYVTIAKEYGIVTVVMYQKEDAFLKWDTIIMLPISDNDDYYAFRIPGAEGAEKRELERKIQTLSINSKNFSFEN